MFESRETMITGCGWVTPFACGGIADVLEHARHLAGSTVSTPAAPPTRVAPDLLGDLGAFPREVRDDHGALLAAVAVDKALGSAGLAPATLTPTRTGLSLGCALAGQTAMIDFANDVRAQTPRFVSPLRFPQTVGNFIAGALARAFNLQGPNLTIARDEASGLVALAEGAALIATGQADVVLAGGVEPLTDAVAAAFGKPQALTEGACFFVLESAKHVEGRQATVLAHVSPAAEPPAAADPVAAIRSVVGAFRAGAIGIEAWVGHCLGAAAPAAVAAAIGAAQGFHVPVVAEDGPAAVTAETLARSGGDAATGSRAALVEAICRDGAASDRYRLFLTLPAVPLAG